MDEASHSRGRLCYYYFLDSRDSKDYACASPSSGHCFPLLQGCSASIVRHVYREANSAPNWVAFFISTIQVKSCGLAWGCFEAFLGFCSF